MNPVVILGAKGTLGGQFKALYPAAVAWDREDVDVTNFEELKQKILALPQNPAAIINCVAFNDVDGAEEKREIAFQLNAEFPGKLAELCKQIDTTLVHFSSNYVFDGQKGEYTETDVPTPISEYGRTKLGGEQLIAEKGEKYYIVRTAVLFGPKGESELSKKSFIDIMLELAGKQPEIKAVNDEINSLTYAKHLAEAVKYLLGEQKPFGLYHITNAGFASWYDLAKELFAFTNKTVQLVPVPSTAFPRKAQRPKKAVLLNTKIYQLPKWEDALREYLLNIKI